MYLKSHVEPQIASLQVHRGPLETFISSTASATFSFAAPSSPPAPSSPVRILRYAASLRPQNLLFLMSRNRLGYQINQVHFG